LYKTATDYRSLGLSLEASEGLFLNPDTLLLIPRSGELLLVDLIGHEDAGRGWQRKRSGVTQFSLQKLGLRGPLPSFLLRTSSWGKGGHFLWASHVGDSLLLKYTERGRLCKSRALGTNKTKKGDEGEQEMDFLDELDQELYGSSGTPASVVQVGNQDTYHEETSDPSHSLIEKDEEDPNDPEFKFQVVDSIQSVCPIRDMAVGQSALIGKEGSASKNPELEVVTCTGEGSSGALGILSQSIRPVQASSFDMTGVLELWSVKTVSSSSMKKSDDPSTDHHHHHSYLFLSKENSTLVLQTGQEFTQLKNSDFFTSGPTVTVNSVSNGTRVLQIEPDGLHLLNSKGKKRGVKKMGTETVWIVSASIVDPFVLVLTNEGKAILFRVTEKDEIIKVNEFEVGLFWGGAMFLRET
jgi:cleavage and polyadenylation specificity factor subunit 1